MSDGESEDDTRLRPKPALSLRGRFRKSGQGMRIDSPHRFELAASQSGNFEGMRGLSEMPKMVKAEPYSKARSRRHMSSSRPD